MLFSIATRRLASTVFVTSSRRLAVLTQLQRHVSRIDRPQHQLTRAFATAKKEASPSSNTSAKAPAKPTRVAGAKKSKRKSAKKAKKPPRKVGRPKKRAIKTPASEALKLVKDRQALKRAALLSEPKKLPQTTWIIYSNTEIQKHADLATGSRDASKTFRALSPSEKQHLEEVAAQNKLLNAAKYAAWVDTYTPAQIFEANKARKQLKEKHNFPKALKNPKLIRDPRIPVKGSTTYGAYIKARWAALPPGTQKAFNDPIVRQFHADWLNMSPQERQPYVDIGKAEAERYEKEVLAVLGHKVGSKKKSKLSS